MFDGETPVAAFDCDGENFYVELACPKCRRFISGDSIKVTFNGFEGLVTDVSAECKKCGPVKPDHAFL